MHGGAIGTSIMWVLLWSAGLLMVFFPMTMRLYNQER